MGLPFSASSVSLWTWWGKVTSVVVGRFVTHGFISRVCFFRIAKLHEIGRALCLVLSMDELWCKKRHRDALLLRYNAVLHVTHRVYVR